MAAERRRLQILMTADTIGGVWQHALELSAALCADGDEVVLATMGAPPTAAQLAQVAAVPGLRLYGTGFKLLWMEQPWRDVRRAGQWLLDLAAQVRPDVVHLNDLGHGALAWPAPVLVAGHSCVASWWQAVHGGALPERWQRYRDTVRASLAAADQVVAPTAWMLQALARHYGPLPRASVIHNGRRRLTVPAQDKQPCILAAGRLWDRAKNLELLARVAPRLPWPVRMAGEAIAPHGGSITLPGAHLLGWLDEAALAREMAAASIYALPARYEPFGLSALEAAQAGCVLVLGDIPSLREVWGEAALYVPDDDRALEQTLLGLIASPAHRAWLASHARRRAAHYLPGTMASRYRALYLELVCRRRRPAAVTRPAHSRLPKEATP